MRLPRGPWPELGIARLGLTLVALTAAAWATGVPYLVFRLGLAFPPGFAHLDAPHAYLGAALAVVLALKAWQLRVRAALARLAGVLAWQRWLSAALLLTYGGVLVSGALLLVPWPATAQRLLVNLHLLTAAWAGLATLAHMARYVRGRVHVPELDGRLAAGVAVALVPALAVAIPALALSPLARLGAGPAWERVGPQGVFVSRLAELPGGELAAAGSGLWTSRDEGRTWTAVPGFGATIVRSISSAGPGGPVYVGTERGVQVAPSADGPYAPTGFTGLADSVLADPVEPGRLWAGGTGLWTSTDGGATWTAAEAGLIPSGYVWSLVRFRGDLYAGASTGVYRWTGGRWDRVSSLPSVYSLDPAGGDLWASSMGGGLEVLRNGRWTASSTGLAAHGSGAIHVDGVTWLGGARLLAATMDSGVAASTDGGRSWSPLSPGFRPGDVWQVLPLGGGRLLAATDTGLYAAPLLPAPAGEWWPWLAALAAALLAGTAGALLAARLPGGRWAWLGGDVGDNRRAPSVTS